MSSTLLAAHLHGHQCKHQEDACAMPYTVLAHSTLLNIIMNTTARIRSQARTFFSLSPITRRQFRLPPLGAIRLLSNSTSETVIDIRLSKLISQHGTNMVMSKRQAERYIQDGGVTVAGQTVTSPSLLLNWKDATSSIKVDGKLLQVQQSPRDTRVWLVHKLAGRSRVGTRSTRTTIVTRTIASIHSLASSQTRGSS